MNEDLHGILGYAQDYSAGFTQRSLVDKGYVNNLASSVSVVVVAAGVNVSSGRIVYVSQGKAYYFDPSDETLAGFTLGITKNAALSDDNVDVQLSGVFEQGGLGLTPDKKYYVGPNGTLLTNITGLKIVQQIGVSISTDKLALNIYSPIITN